MYKESRQPADKLVTPKEAEAYLAINNFPGQRAYNPFKGRLYAENMESGTHRRIDIAVAKVRETGIDYLMNGQHNCQAVIIYGKPYQASVSYYMCDTMEDAWRLFATFDVHSSRTEQQFMHSRRELFTDERLHTIPLRVLQACGTALTILTDGKTDPRFCPPKNKIKTIKADYVEKYPDDVIFVSQFKDYRHMMVIGCVTAIIATSRKNKQEATLFWSRVATGEMLTRNDPRAKLRDALLDTSFLGNVRGGENRQRAIYTLCIVWWNSWRSNDGRKFAKVSSMNTIPYALD